MMILRGRCRAGALLYPSIDAQSPVLVLGHALVATRIALELWLRCGYGEQLCFACPGMEHN